MIRLLIAALLAVMPAGRVLFADTCGTPDSTQPYEQVLTRDLEYSPLLASLMTDGRANDDVDLDVIQPVYDELLQGFFESPVASRLDDQTVRISALVLEFAATFWNDTIATLQTTGCRRFFLKLCRVRWLSMWKIQQALFWNCARSTSI